MKRSWPLTFIIAGVLFFLASLILPSARPFSFVAVIFACACIASGILFLIANRKFKA